MNGAVLEWSYNPWRDRPAQAAGAVLAVALCVLLLTALTLPLVMAIVLGFAILPPFVVAIVPSRYRIDDAGVCRRFGWLTERRSWRRVRRAVRLRRGVLLSPFADASRLENLVGFHLVLPAGGSDQAADLDRILASRGL